MRQCTPPQCTCLVDVRDANQRSCGDPIRANLDSAVSTQEGTDAHLIEVNLDTSDVRCADRDHAEEAICPPPEQRDALIQDKQIL